MSGRGKLQVIRPILAGRDCALGGHHINICNYLPFCGKFLWATMRTTPAMPFAGPLGGGACE